MKTLDPSASSQYGYSAKNVMVVLVRIAAQVVPHLRIGFVRAGENVKWQHRYAKKLIRAIRGQFTHLRHYKVSNSKMGVWQARRYCEDKDLGLAVWRTEEEYQDILFLMDTLGEESLFTALSNRLRRDCNSVEQCDANLVWKQTSNGPEEYFQRISSYTIP